MRKAWTRITRDHENNMVTGAVPNEEYDVEPEPLLRRSQRIRRRPFRYGDFVYY